MKISDMFLTKSKKQTATTEKRNPTVKRQRSSQKITPITFSPSSFEDVQKILNCLIDGNAVIVNLKQLSDDTCLRVVDLLTGGVYVLGATMSKIDTDIYLIVYDN